jgi:predicted ATPase/transcriptional regulator with XRE-family HTH domain
MGDRSTLLADFHTFGDLLKYLRRRAQLTQRELSIVVGYSEAQISRLEANLRVPDQASLMALFIPALSIQEESETIQRLLELAKFARASDQSMTERQRPAGEPGLPVDPAESAHRHNLPVQLTSFIGREKEIGALHQLVTAGPTRLVTLTGSGGVGKTRLAIRTAEELLDDFADGVWLVQLAALADPDLVPVTVAAALGLREVADQPILQVLVDYLRNKHMLILLDTCEHLVGTVASLVDRILHTAPFVSILATSREILGVNGEMIFHCPSLALPDPQLLLATTDKEKATQLISCEAVRLFAERSALATPGFVVMQNNVAIIAQVCCRLDGIPLAIELAAARTRMLSVEQIADRLDHAFLLLTGGSRTALPRQQTLKATIDWSYNLLSSAERTLFLRLSIFSGGWTIEAAEAVCSGDWDNSVSLLPEEILDLLSRLVDKSLVLAEPGESGLMRYRMLDTVRQYAHESLLEAGGDAAVRGRHLDYFLQLAEQAEPHLRAWGMIEWLKRLETELPNLRLALDWSLSGQPEKGLRLGTALMMFWHLHSRRFEGIQWLERLLEADQAGEALWLRSLSQRIVRGKALIVAGNLNHYYPGIYSEHSRLQLEEGKQIFQEMGDQALSYQPFAMLLTASSEEDFKNSLAMARRVGNEFFTAEAIWILKNFHLERGDLEQAKINAQEHLAIRQKTGDVDGEAFALYQLAEIEFLQGNFRRAMELWDQSKRTWRLVGENNEFSLFFSSLPARVAIVQGNYQQAAVLSEAQLALGVEISSSLVIAEALAYIGLAAWSLKEYGQASRRCQEILGPDWENRLPCGRGVLFYYFGRVALSQGDYAQAGIYLSQCATIAIPEKFLGLQAMGILAAVSRQDPRSAILFGALDQHVSWLKNVSSPAEQAEYEKALTLIRADLGEKAFAAARDVGQGLTFEQTLEMARTITGNLTPDLV